MKLLPLLFVTLYSWPISMGCAGVRTPIGEVTLDNVPIGEEINMRELSNTPYRVMNTSDKPVILRMAIVGQDPGEYVKAGYEKIPDLGWIRLDKTEFRLAPGEEGITDVFINIPKDEKYLSKKYQAYIWAQSYPLEEEPGINVLTGVKSRVLLNISPVPFTRTERKKIEELKASLGFQLMPDHIEAEDVKLGKKLKLKKIANKIFKLVNPNDEDLTFSLSVAERGQAFLKLPDGWEDPPKDNTYLTIEPPELIVKGNSIEELKLTLQIPKADENKGKKWLFVIKILLKNTEVPVTYLGRIFVTTKAD